jgi:protein phosphatase
MSHKHITSQILQAVDVIKNQQGSFFDVEGKLISLGIDGRMLVVGDLHGDLRSLTKILQESRFIQRVKSGEILYLVFLGDYIDRGPHQIEVLLGVTKLLIDYPSNVILLRGNHEGPRDVIANPHDFPNELRSRFGANWDRVYDSFRDLADELYTAAIAPESAFLCHGGIPTNTVLKNRIAYAHINHPKESTLIEILWNDPRDIQGKISSYRGIGYYFGSDLVIDFLRRYGLNWLIRGHESAQEGFLLQSKTLTLFSCKLPHYGNNKGAYLELPLSEKNVEMVDFLHTF